MVKLNPYYETCKISLNQTAVDRASKIFVSFGSSQLSEPSGSLS